MRGRLHLTKHTIEGSPTSHGLFGQLFPAAPPLIARTAAVRPSFLVDQKANTAVNPVPGAAFAVERSQARGRGFMQRLLGQLRTLFSPRISRDPMRFHVKEIPIVFTDAMGMTFSVPFHLFAAYEACWSRLIWIVIAVAYIVFAALCHMYYTSLQS